MKKYVLSLRPLGVLTLLIALGFGPLNGGLRAPATAAPSSAKMTVLATVSVHFGRGPSCVGRGICSVSDVGGLSSPTGSAALGLLWSDQEDHLQLQIAKGNISVEQKEAQFIGGQFKVIDAFEIPPGLATQIGAVQSTIPPGDYVVTEHTDHYQIRF